MIAASPGQLSRPLWSWQVGQPVFARKRFCRSRERFRRILRIVYVRAHFLCEDKLRVIISQKGFCVKGLAMHLGLDVRTLERRFVECFRTTPKTWLMRERINQAPSLLTEGLSNKEVAAALGYTCESNFCRDFKRYFGRAPQAFARLRENGEPDKESNSSSFAER